MSSTSFYILDHLRVGTLESLGDWMLAGRETLIGCFLYYCCNFSSLGDSKDGSRFILSLFGLISNFDYLDADERYWFFPEMAPDNLDLFSSTWSSSLMKGD